MEATNNKKCCEGCKKGQPGQNEACKAKLMVEKIQQNLVEPYKKTIV